MSINASDGVELDLDDLPLSFNYNADGTLNYMQVTYRGNTYRKTFTYSSGKVSVISNWVKQ